MINEPGRRPALRDMERSARPISVKEKGTALIDGAFFVVLRKLLRALVDPGADQADFLRRQGLDAGFVAHRGHPGIMIFRGMSNHFDDEAVGAIASLHDG